MSPAGGGRPPLRRVVVVGGRGWVTTLTDEGTRTESLRVAWQLDEFAAALAVGTAAEVRVRDDIDPGDVGPGTAVLGAGSAVRALAGRPGGPLVIELGVGSSSAGLRRVAEAGLAGGVDLEAYEAWQRDREAGGRMFGRVDVAEHLRARLTLRSGAHCSLGLDGIPLARLVARYLETYAALLGPA